MPVESSGAERVSTLELFFDLVFVFTVTQVSSVVVHDPGWRAVGQALLESLAIYWMYGGYAWLTNTLGASSGRLRAALLLGMATFAVTSLAVPRAFGSDGEAFGWAYLLVNVAHLAGFSLGGTREAARGIRRVAPSNLTAAVLILVAGYAGAPAHWWLWTAAILVQWLPAAVSTTRRHVFSIGAAHFAERHGLMVIIVLGESLVSVSLAAEEQDVSWRLVAGVLAGLAASSALWWLYFAGDDDRAAEAFAERNPDPLLSYDLPHVLMLNGIIGIAAGSRLSLPDLTQCTSLAASALLAGGAACYFAGLSLFRAMLRFAPARGRLAAGAVVLALIPLGRSVAAAAELGGVAMVAAAVVLLEVRARSSAS